MAGSKHTFVMDVSLDALWDVITDYEGYSDFVTGSESVTITKKEGKNTWAEYVVSMFGKKIRYTLKHTELPKKSLKWTMTEGEFFKSNDGGWDLEAQGDDQVKATYTVDVGFPLLVPKSIVNGLTSTQLPAMMKAFEEQAKKKSKKKPAAAKASSAAKPAAKGKKK